MWAITANHPVEWSAATGVMVDLCGIAPKSADGIIRCAIKHKHLTRCGNYTPKIDTRTIERREPTNR